MEWYKNRSIYILPDGQTAIKTLGNCQINSTLLWDCHQPLVKLAERNRVLLVWVSGHRGIRGNEIADKMSGMGSGHPFIRPESACSISMGVTIKAVRDWINRESKTALKHTKGFLRLPSPKRARELLILNGTS
jgi:hypothetical protein